MSRNVDLQNNFKDPLDRKCFGHSGMGFEQLKTVRRREIDDLRKKH